MPCPAGKELDVKGRIIIVEDEKDIAELISYHLKREGFDVFVAGNGEEALKSVETDKFDLIILDLMLPGITGLELCRVIKGTEETASIPIVMVTAKCEEFDKVLGLEMGADDYITKPFSAKELVARIKAVLRRTGKTPKQVKMIRIGDLQIDTESYQVYKRDKRIKLSATEFNLLVYMARRKGRVFNRDMLLDAVWKDEAFVEPRTVDVHIWRLRAQIEDDSSKPEYVKTRRGIGYYVDGDI